MRKFFRNFIQTAIMRLLLFIVAVIVSTGTLTGQEFIYKHNSKVKLYEGSREKTIPFAGGFNNPQLAMADLNHDGKQDLIVYERYNSLIKTFINTGPGGNPIYSYDPKYAAGFPAVSNYLIMLDYNRDGIADLFHRGNTGIEVYTGYYDGLNRLAFRPYKALFYNNDLQSPGSINAYVEPYDIPMIGDVDKDGDLDFIAFWAGGSQLFLYRNYQEEDDLPKDSISIKLVDRCWGKTQQAIKREHTLGFTCNNGGLGRSTGGGERHTGNTLCLFDADGDSDMDYLNGNISYSDIQFLQNGKAQNANGDNIIAQDTTWQQFSLDQWPAAFNLDIDQDGKKDILITPHAEGTSENYKTISFFKNTGTLINPAFTFQSDTFLVDNTIDLGTASSPALYDYNRDGKLDLFAGSDGYYENGIFRSRISYYQNTSSNGQPSFTVQTNDFLNIHSLDLKGTAPAIGDLDNDSKDDFIIGQSDGTLTLFTNNAADNHIQPQWVNPVTKIRDINNIVIDVGNNASPFIYDLDKDGKPDLLIGNMQGYIVYYQNVSTTPGILQLQKVNTKLGNAKADPQVSFLGYSKPYIGKIDSTGTEYLLLGSETGAVYKYTGFQSGDTAATYQLVDTQYAGIKNVGARVTPTIGDIDGDGKYDIIFGNINGGLMYYSLGLKDEEAPADNAPAYVNIYPNPASGTLYVEWNSTFTNGKVDVALVNILGQKVLQQSYTTELIAKMDVSHLASGIYYCIIISGKNKVAKAVSIFR